MGGQLRRPPIDFRCKKEYFKREYLIVEYLKKSNVYKDEKSLPKCMDLDLCDGCRMESVGSVVLVTLIAQVWSGEE